MVNFSLELTRSRRLFRLKFTASWHLNDDEFIHSTALIHFKMDKQNWWQTCQMPITLHASLVYTLWWIVKFYSFCTASIIPINDSFHFILFAFGIIDFSTAQRCLLLSMVIFMRTKWLEMIFSKRFVERLKSFLISNDWRECSVSRPCAIRSRLLQWNDVANQSEFILVFNAFSCLFMA